MTRWLVLLLLACWLPGHAATLRIALQLEPPLLDPTVGAADRKSVV